MITLTSAVTMSLLALVAGLPGSGSAASKKLPMPSQQAAPAVAKPAPAQVRFVNFIESADAANVTVNDRPAAASLAFGKASAEEKLAVGTEHLVVKQNDKTLLDTKIEIAKERDYVVVLRGNLASARAELLAVTIPKEKSHLTFLDMRTTKNPLALWIDGKLMENTSVGVTHGCPLAAGSHLLEVRDGEKVVVSRKQDFANQSSLFVFLYGHGTTASPFDLLIVNELRPSP